jgi:ornithine carbamoyltransferase
MLRETRTRYSFKEACQLIGCSHVFLRREIRARRIGPVVRVNARVIWIARAVVDAYLARRTS